MLVGTGLWAGAIMGIAVDRCSIWPRMSLEEYVVDFRRHLRRMDPLMPILGVIGMVGSILLAVKTTGGTAGWAVGAAVLIGVVILGSVTIAEPINFQFRRLPMGTAPKSAERLLRNWRRFHRVRCAVAIAATISTALAIVT
jgi:Domain of unknown function (DUF1772)